MTTQVVDILLIIYVEENAGYSDENLRKNDTGFAELVDKVRYKFRFSSIILFFSK